MSPPQARSPASTGTQVIRALFIPREPFPNDRVRINVLFGRELLARGHAIDLVMQAANPAVPLGPLHWHGRTIWVGPTDSAEGAWHRIRKHWRALRHDLRYVYAARRSAYDALLVSDKFLLASIALVIARARGLKFLFWLTFPYPEAELESARRGTARYPWLARIRASVSSWLLYTWVLPRSDFIFVQSARMKEDIRARGIDPDLMMPIASGFDPGAIAPRTALAPPRNESALVTIGYLGTLSSARRLD